MTPLKKVALILLVTLFLINLASGQDIVTKKNNVDIRTWTGEMQYHPDGLNQVTVETNIDGERFQANDVHKPDAASVRYASPEKTFLIFPDPKVQQEYQIYENGTIEETLFLKERNDVTWNVELTGNDYLVGLDGGYKIVNPDIDEKENGYVYISPPSGWDANGVHISYTFELGEDGHTLTLIDPQGHKNDNHDNIAYPVVVDPTFTHRYDLVLLMHGNYETDTTTPTQDYRDSSRNFRVGAVAAGTANSGNTTKLFGNGSYFVANGNITIPDSPDFTLGTNNWSWSFSLYEPIAQYNGTEIGQFQDANNYNRIRIVATSGPIFTAVRGGSTVESCSGVALKAPGWTNITVIQNGTSCSVYTNGTTPGAGAARTGSLTDLSAPFMISSLTSSFTYSAVNIDEVKIFNGGFAPTINEIDGMEYPLFLNATTRDSNFGYADDNSTVSLLHFDGATAGTVIKDQVANRTWTATSSYTNTSQKKFGTASIWLNDVSGNIVAQNGSVFDFGSGNFTVDFWYNKIGTAGLGGVFMTNSTASTSGFLILDLTGTMTAFASNTTVAGSWGVFSSLNMGTTDPPGTWTHYAIVRDANDVYTFKNGQMVSHVTSPFSIVPSNGNVAMGVAGGRSSPFASIDEFRISKYPRWTANFTPPTYAYEVTQPSFTATPSALANPGSVQFNDTTPDSTWTQNGYYWDFGDNTTSTLQNPSHTYSADGIYIVTLNTLNNNMTAATSKTLPVGAPIVDFSCTPTAGTAALQVTCTDLTTNSSPITSYFMDFGDGGTSTATPPWTHVYSAFGSYSVNLTETNPVGTGFEYKRDYIITSTNQNQQQTFYTPHQVRYKIVDSMQNPLQGATVRAYYVSTSMPSNNVTWLSIGYGVPLTVANDMINGNLAMVGTTGNDGYVTFTQHGSLYYNIYATYTPLSVVNYSTQVMPLDNEYILQIQKNPVTEYNVNNTYQEINSTVLNVSFPNISYVRAQLYFQDNAGQSTNLKFMVFDGLNGTVYNTQTVANPGTSVNYLWYDLPNVRGNQYIWNYSATRV